MSFKEILTCTCHGFLDSLKGFYWLYTLDHAQRRAHADRLEYRELTLKMNSSRNKPMRTTDPKMITTHSINKSSNKEEPRLLNRVVQCCTLNGFVFGLSIILFNHLLLPMLQSLLSLLFFNASGQSNEQTFWFWLQLLLKWTFDSLWVLPLFILSRVVNALWFQDIGTLAYRYSVGRAKGISSLSNFIADNLFSLIIQALFLVQAFLLTLLPLPGGIVYNLHMTLLYSLYSFEYKWVQMGWPLHQRLKFLESNWPYFIGFGMPLTLLTWWPKDFVISGCLFAIVFPIFIISGNEAEVRQVNWTPTSSKYVSRLQLFSGVVYISNLLFTSTVNKRRK